MTTTDDPPLILWGRCRSGRRWFWTARDMDGDDAHGWADSPDEASRQANAAALGFAAGRYANVHVLHGVAASKLKALNTAKRAATPPKPKRSRTVPFDETAAVDFLYAINPPRYDADDRWIPASIVRLPITKKTSRRVYYLRPRGPREHEVGFVDRQQLEAHGCVHATRWLMLFAEPPELPKPVTPPTLKELKAQMANAHPDRGGSDAEFIAARERYLKARQRAT